MGYTVYQSATEPPEYVAVDDENSATFLFTVNLYEGGSATHDGVLISDGVADQDQIDAVWQVVTQYLLEQNSGIHKTPHRGDGSSY